MPDKLKKVNGTGRGNVIPWISFIIGILCLILIIRNVEWEEFLNTLTATNWLFLSFGAVFVSLNWVIRAYRWQNLMHPVQRITFWDSFAYIMIGYLANLFLPMRIGELVRGVLLGREKKINVSATLATLVVEKLLDVVSLIFFIIVLSLVIDIPAEWRTGILVIEAVAVVGLLTLVAISFLQRDFTWLERVLPGFIPDSIKTRGLYLLRSFIDGLAALKSWRQALLVGIQSIMAWGLVAVSIYFFILAVGLSLPWHASMFTVVVTNLGTAVIATPGGFGVFHFLTIVALGNYAVSEGAAFSLAILFHESFIMMQTVIGFSCLWAKGFSFKQIQQQNRINSTTLTSEMEII